jgi:CRISPR/Cas system-associated endoribonuclease Cas2
MFFGFTDWESNSHFEGIMAMVQLKFIGHYLSKIGNESYESQLFYHFNIGAMGTYIIIIMKKVVTCCKSKL